MRMNYISWSHFCFFDIFGHYIFHLGPRKMRVPYIDRCVHASVRASVPAFNGLCVRASIRLERNGQVHFTVP